MEYYWLLRSVLRALPHLRTCLTRCRHCGLFFLTHPRNAGRHNLRCAFGCREAYRKQAAAQRTAAYYRSPEGKKKKADLNQRRRDQGAARRARTAGRKTAAGKAPAIPANSAIIAHVRTVVSLLEGRSVSRRAVLQLVAKNKRQHTMCRRRKIDQAVRWLNKHPP